MNNYDALLNQGFALLLSKADRDEIYQEVLLSLEKFAAQNDESRVFNIEVQSEVFSTLRQFSFELSQRPHDVARFVLEGLQTFQLNTSHPSYFGVFNPRASTMGIVAEMIVAAMNPQLASSVSSKFCIGIEDLLINYFGERFGYLSGDIEGVFTVGATEANHTALLCALTSKLSGFTTDGLRGHSAMPIIYCSEETHHSVMRAGRLCGLGTNAVRVLPVDAALQFDVILLEEQIKKDRANGNLPLFLVGTLGSTSAGVIDPLSALADISVKYNLWFHVDAAFGGAVSLLDEFSDLMKETARADSISFDPHKWLSVPMGCGMYISRHKGSMRATFDVEGSSYMPATSRENIATEPYRQSMQWSRRFMGLKLFMTLAVHGEKGYREVLRHQIRMGVLLKDTLSNSDWLLKNNTPLPVVCFTDQLLLARDVDELVRRVVATKRAFLTTTNLSHKKELVCRAGIPNFMTQARHVEGLVGFLNDVRREMHESSYN